MDTWSSLLSAEAKHIARKLMARVDDEIAAGYTIYPPKNQIFRALELTPPRTVNAVIIGQDPYHGQGQANGLAFSVNPGVKIPPSLRNIFKELHNDVGCPIPQSGDLTPWAKHGVLLLNTVLTVEKGLPASHSTWGWQAVVLDICRVCLELPQPIVFILWGGHARAFAAGLRISEHDNKFCIYSSHPSPLGAMKGNEAVPAFIGSRPFSKTNQLLMNASGEPVKWDLSV